MQKMSVRHWQTIITAFNPLKTFIQYVKDINICRKTGPCCFTPIYVGWSRWWWGVIAEFGNTWCIPCTRYCLDQLFILGAKAKRTSSRRGGGDRFHSSTPQPRRSRTPAYDNMQRADIYWLYINIILSCDRFTLYNAFIGLLLRCIVADLWRRGRVFVCCLGQFVFFVY